MNKSILLISHTPIDNDTRVIKIAESLKDRGYSVHFIGFKNEFSPLSRTINATYLKHKQSIIKRILRRTLFPVEYSDFIGFAYKKLYETRIDLVWANDLPCLYPGYQISKKFNAKLIYDSHEIYTETLNQFFPKSKHLKKWFYKMNLDLLKTAGCIFERKYGGKSDYIITVNNSLKAYFRETYGWSNIQVLKNAPNKVDKLSPVKDVRKELGIDKDVKVVLYQGNLNPGRGLFHLFEAFKSLPDNYHLIILGSGVLENTLRKYANELQIEDHIHFYGYVSPNVLMSYTQSADLGICFLEPINKSKELALPNKIFEYLICHVPILGSHSPEISNILNQFDIGSACDLHSKTIAENIQRLCENYNLRTEETERFLKEYNWESEFSRLMSAIEEVAIED